MNNDDRRRSWSHRDVGIDSKTSCVEEAASIARFRSDEILRYLSAEELNPSFRGRVSGRLSSTKQCIPLQISQYGRLGCHY